MTAAKGTHRSEACCQMLYKIWFCRISYPRARDPADFPTNTTNLQTPGSFPSRRCLQRLKGLLTESRIAHRLAHKQNLQTKTKHTTSHPKNQLLEIARPWGPYIWSQGHNDNHHRGSTETPQRFLTSAKTEKEHWANRQLRNKAIIGMFSFWLKLKTYLRSKL